MNIKLTLSAVFVVALVATTMAVIVQPANMAAVPMVSLGHF